MLPESETAVTATGGSRAKTARPRRGARARPARAAAGQDDPPVARILQLVAAMKAEHDGAGMPVPAAEAGERVKLMGWLRRILDTRAQERQAWEEQVRGLEARFAAAEAAARAAQEAVEQADLQHHRLVADLKLMHEHQRSIWGLERRRLEITIDGLQRDRRNTLVRRAARLARPAVAAALLLVSLAALALSADSTAAAGATLLDGNEYAPVVVIAFD